MLSSYSSWENVFRLTLREISNENGVIESMGLKC